MPADEVAGKVTAIRIIFAYVCTYVYIYMCVCVYMYIYIYMCTRAHVCGKMHVDVFDWVCAYAYTNTNVYVYTCIYRYISLSVSLTICYARVTQFASNLK